jgi:hypothetical protein
MTLVERTLEVLASLEDDFYEPEDINNYLNAVVLRMVSMMNVIERDSTRSLRALDGLRKQLLTDTSGIAAEGSYFTGTIAVPQDLFQVQYVEYNNGTPLREIPTTRRSQLRWSNAIPTSAEGYYVYATAGSVRNITFYVHRDDNDVDIAVEYLKTPSLITLASVAIPDLPDQFIKPLIYGAAEMASIKENARESADNALAYRKYGEKFEQFFQSALF